MKESTFKKYKLVVDEWLINGFNGTQAYQKFYPKAKDETASTEFLKILRIPKLQEYKESKQKNTSDSLQITLETQIKQLQELVKLTKDSEKYSDTINALKEQSKLLGLYQEHNNQKNGVGNIPIESWLKNNDTSK